MELSIVKVEKKGSLNTNSLNQSHLAESPDFYKSYPIIEVSKNHNIHMEQSDYTLTELKNVSCTN